MIETRQHSDLSKLEIEYLGKRYIITQEVEVIDSKKAQEYLSRVNPNQRKRNRAHSDRIEEAINAGEFMGFLSGHIMISSTGLILDGVHRLYAVLGTDKTITVLVLRGVPEDAYKYLDQNKARTVKDTFSSSGLANAKETANAVKFLYQIVMGKVTNPRNEVASRFADDYPEFKASVTFAKAYATGTQIPVAVGAVMHFLYSFVLLSDTKHRDYYEEKYRNAMEVLKYGHPVIMKSSRHPIKMLKKKLTEEDVNRSGGRFSPGDWERAGGGPRDARYPTLSWVYQALRACIIEEKRPFAWKPEATTPEIIGEISRLARSKITFRHDPGM